MVCSCYSKNICRILNFGTTELYKHQFLSYGLTQKSVTPEMALFCIIVKQSMLFPHILFVKSCQYMYLFFCRKKAAIAKDQRGRFLYTTYAGQGSPGIMNMRPVANFLFCMSSTCTMLFI